MTSLWRHVTFSSTMGSRTLIEPIAYARMRISQNIIADQKECGYQRQSGRTFRMILRALEAAESGYSVLVVTDSEKSCKRLHDTASTWASQLAIKGQEVSSGHHIRFKKNSPAMISFVPSSFDTLKGISYDFALFDNVITDRQLVSQQKQVSESLVSLVTRVQSACRRKDIMSAVDSPDGAPWSIGDLFKIPGADAVGTLLSINRVSSLPIGLSVLYNQCIMQLPLETLDVLQKVTSAN